MQKPFILLLILAGLAAVGYFGFQPRHKEPPAVLTLYGNIDQREVELAINGTERIAAMYCWEGDRVEKGQLLAELELDRFQAEVARLQAEVAAAQALVEKLERGSRPQEIRQAQAALAEAKAQEQIAWLTYQRLRKLLSKQLVSPEDVDHAKASAEAASAHREAAEQALSLILEGPRQEDIAAARATLAATVAQLALAEHNLKDACLYAPAAGIIQKRLLEPGAMATPQRPVYTLALTDPRWARVYVDEPDLGKIRLGMPAVIETDSFPGKRYLGWVGYLSPTAEFTPQTVETEALRTHLVYQVRVYACDPEGELRLGMPVTVKIPLGQASNAAPPCRQQP